MLIRLWIYLGLLVASLSSLAETVVITSFPERFYSQVSVEFIRVYPWSDVRFIN